LNIFKNAKDNALKIASLSALKAIIRDCAETLKG
jgi:hypothetical protein